jgi:glycosyltransferase involved in cell wall biosynthesis
MGAELTPFSTETVDRRCIGGRSESGLGETETASAIKRGERMSARGARVLMLARGVPEAAASRYRLHQFIPGLEGDGFRCTYEALFPQAYIEGLARGDRHHLLAGVACARRALSCFSARRYDVLLMEKELIPFVPWILERWMLRGNRPLVVDYDDAISHRYDQSQSVIVRRLLGGKISDVMRKADCVLVGNRYLASVARSAGARWVELFPTVVDLGKYPAAPAARQGRSLRVGWIGSPTTVQYLRLIEDELREFCRTRMARMVVIGSPPTEQFRFPVERHRWSQATEAAVLASCDIGVMPLTDTPWERGKCGLKLIQFMACYLPVVASAVGANLEIVEEGGSGFLVKSPAGWKSALERLAGDKELRQQMGSRGREIVEERYNLQEAAPHLSAVLKRVLERSSRLAVGAAGHGGIV